MKIGLFSVIEWSFLDQRPQVLSKQIAQWGHEVVYFEPFIKLKHWGHDFHHPWGEYEDMCWKPRQISLGLSAVTMLSMPEHNLLSGIISFNKFYRDKNKQYIKSLNLDLAIVVDPFWGSILDEMEIPYIYDHVDDTHHMEAVITNSWHDAQEHCKRNALTSMYIQPNIARRARGLYVPNGIDLSQGGGTSKESPIFDCGCLSAIADWFDIESILNSQKTILIVGPIENNILERYNDYRNNGHKNVTWIPRLPRFIGMNWLKSCKTAVIPFNDLHPVVDYVMPLKLVEYLSLGLPTISYLNKGIEEEFSDFVTFYSSVNWRGLPKLDDAIDQAINKFTPNKLMMEYAKKFSWELTLNPLNEVLHALEKCKGAKSIPDAIGSYMNGYKVKLIRESLV